MPTTAPYGSWKSPITADLIVAQSIRLSSPSFDGPDMYWIESRPQEAGRSALVCRRQDGTISDVTPPTLNVRTRVHEYGGGAYVVKNGTAYVSNFSDNRVYRLRADEAAVPLTPEGLMRYADFEVDERRNRLICVREDHSNAGAEAVNTIASIPADGGESRVLIDGNDFYSDPRISRDGSRLAWLAWRHPNMPWDGSEVWVGTIDADGSVVDAQRVAGGEGEGLFGPQWSPDGSLIFISDVSGWWNPYRWDGSHVEQVVDVEAEFGAPQWVFGQSTYAFIDASRLLCIVTRNGEMSLQVLDLQSGTLRPLDTGYTVFDEAIQVEAGKALCIAASPESFPALVEIDVHSGAAEVVRRSTDVDVDACYLSKPERITYPTEGGRSAHAIFYPPHNCDYQAPAGEKPPLIVHTHGGPTGMSTDELSLSHQYWTSRGFAYVDVNYGGSTGYGREYRRRLEGQWGIVDVDDAVNAARYLADRGDADPTRFIITGGSAGGYTTLRALTSRTDFAAGVSYFGIGDLEPFATDTHKFESRYLDRLVGPYPERADLYRERSPVHFADRISCPVVLFQGLDDKVVPPNQAELMVETLQAKGLPHAYVAYEGEGHGFRRAENMKRSLEGELYFYGRIFGFQPADQMQPLSIANLTESDSSR